MREIEFRGKRCDTGSGKMIISGEWGYGDLTRFSEEVSFITEDFVEHRVCKVATITVGQYTGLKDKNGVKIFEGDIVRITEKINGNFIERVFTKKRICWQGGAFVFQPVDRDLSYPNLIRLNENETMEVIGNIHDNPELIEESE